MAKKSTQPKGQNVRISHVDGGKVNVAGGDIHQEERNINTGGGAYIGGSVNTGGGDFVGRDQIKSGMNISEATKLFETIYQKIDAHPTLNKDDKADLTAEVKGVQAEAAKGEDANESLLARELRNVRRMAPDILDVVLATLANPAAGFGMVVKKVAERMKAEAS